MATVQTQNLPGIGNRGLSVPRVETVQPFSDGGQLMQQGAQLASAAIQAQEKARVEADTSMLMDADAQLSQSKLDMMFNPQTGVYAKKGKSALDVTNQTLPQFDKRADEIEKTLTNDAQRARFNVIRARQREQLNLELNRYELGEREAYYDSAERANVATSMESAVAYANQPEMVAHYQNKGVGVIAAAGRRKGLSDEEIAQQVQDFNSNTAVAVINKMATDDPLRAQQYFATAAPMMNSDARQKTGAMLGTAVRQQMAGNIVNKVWSDGELGDSALTALIIQKESGGDTMAVSNKGARGMMQLMPETAEEMAAKLNVPYDEERLTSDPQYNIALGTAYINEMLGRYDGNKALALAAYNAGPGKVDEWLKKNGDPRSGDVTAQEWVAKIPYKETRDYTASILAESMPAGVSAKESYAQGLKVVSSLQDKELRGMVEDGLELKRKAADAEHAAIYEQASDAVGDVGYAAIPAQVLSQLSTEDKAKLQRLDEQLNKGVPQRTDYTKLEEFLSMPPAKLAGLSLARDIQPYLKDSDFNTVRAAWTDAKNGKEGIQQAAKAENDVIERTMQMAGIITGSSKDAVAPENLRLQDQFRAAVQGRKDSFFIKEGRQPTVEEVQEMSETMLLDAKLSRKYYLDKSGQQVWQLMPESMQNAYIDKGDITIDKVPPASRAQIVQAMRRDGRTPSEANIVAAYIESISGLGLEIK